MPHISFDYSEYDNKEDWDFKLWPTEAVDNYNNIYYTAKLSSHMVTFNVSLN